MEVHSPLNSFGYWTLNKYYYYLLLYEKKIYLDICTIIVSYTYMFVQYVCKWIWVYFMK